MNSFIAKIIKNLYLQTHDFVNTGSKIYIFSNAIDVLAVILENKPHKAIIAPSNGRSDGLLVLLFSGKTAIFGGNEGNRTPVRKLLA